MLSMKKLLLIVTVLATPALAELPPPTPEQKAKFEKQAAAQKAMLERQEQALAETQRRIARQYRDGPPPKVSEKIGKGDVPKAAQQPPGTPGEPHAGRAPSNPQAEAHSQSAN
jgi:hypothetical protein